MTVTVLLGACTLDVLIGDPRWLPHPVRWIGRLIAWGERRFSYRWVDRPGTARLIGTVVAIGLPTLSYCVVWGTIHVADLIHGGQVVEVLFTFWAFASRDLADHALAVRNALQAGHIDQGRQAVSQIVGRDTQDLPESEVVRATVETVAESTNDGFVAPLLFLVVGGAAAGWAYKTINTLDSMIGHKEWPYRDIGWASARLDDVVNWIPARLTALLVLMAAGIRFVSWSRVREGWHTLLRDGVKHPSPNSGRPEAAMAGVLGIQLGGMNQYDGRTEVRATMGTVREAMTVGRITEAVTLMWIIFTMSIALACLVVR